MDTEQTQPLPPDQPPPKRLTRATDGRMIAGVCAGVGRHFGVDAALVRIAAVVLAFAAGLGVILYLAGALLLPADDKDEAVVGGDRTVTVVVVVLLLLVGWPLVLGGGLIAAGAILPLALLAGAGLITWWLASGNGPGGETGDVVRWSLLGIGLLIICSVLFMGGAAGAAFGDGWTAAAIAGGAGVVLLVGAVAGFGRVLILPALSLALAAGFVGAAGVNLDGGVGEKDYKPQTAADIREKYELGLGEITVDLRDTDLPPGDTPLGLDIGIGEARVLVDEGVCVSTHAKLGIGAVSVFGRDNEGIDVEVDEAERPRPGGSRLVVDAEVGLGELTIDNDARRTYTGGFDTGRDRPDVDRSACGGDAP